VDLGRIKERILAISTLPGRCSIREIILKGWLPDQKNKGTVRDDVEGELRSLEILSEGKKSGNYLARNLYGQTQPARLPVNSIVNPTIKTLARGWSGKTETPGRNFWGSERKLLFKRLRSHH